MKRLGLLFLLVVALSGAAFAQADISGIGTDFESHFGLIYCEVFN